MEILIEAVHFLVCSLAVNKTFFIGKTLANCIHFIKRAIARKVLAYGALGRVIIEAIPRIFVSHAIDTVVVFRELIAVFEIGFVTFFVHLIGESAKPIGDPAVIGVLGNPYSLVDKINLTNGFIS